MVMHAFAGDSLNDGDESSNLSDLFPDLRIMPATKAADCGVSSRLCHRLYRLGMVPNMHMVAQEMGHVDRRLKPVLALSQKFEFLHRPKAI